jgi:RND family efflux transporter MFP subunit
MERSMRNWKVVLGIVVVVVAVVGILLRNRATMAASVPRSSILTDVPVSVAVARTEELQDTLSLVGTVNANNDVNVVAETQGRVIGVAVQVGDYVRAGAPLVLIDDTLKAANLVAAEVSYEKAKKDFDRYESLFKRNSITAAQFDAARQSYKVAEAQYLTAKKQFTDTRITTPISGYVTSRSVDVGAMVAPGISVANVVDISTLKVKLNVSEKDAFRLKVGDPVSVSTEVYPGSTFPGKIRSIAAKGDDAHTYPVEIAIPNSREHPLKAGMFARIGFVSLVSVRMLSVPRDALIGSVKEPQIYLVQNGKAKLRNIVVSDVVGSRLAVARGLAEGDTVVVNGQNNLKDDADVVVIH